MKKSDVAILRKIADDMLLTDGDRDRMNPSRLSCAQTTAAAKALQMCANFVEKHVRE